MLIQEEIKHAAIGLPRGHTVRTICPFCHASHEKSFAITRDFDMPWRLVFMCHRGSCAYNSGVVDDRDGAVMLVTGPDDQAPRYDKPLSVHQDVPDGFLNDILARYNISPDYLRRQGVRYNSAGHSLCMPWRNPGGDQVGWVEKRFTATTTMRKSHHELAVRSYHSRLAFPRARCSYHSVKSHGGVCVLVEGMLDAYRLAELAEVGSMPVYPVALLGAQISSPDAALVASLFDKVAVLLDPDQWPKGHLRVRSAFKVYPLNSVVMTITTDPKDADSGVIRRVLEALMEGPWNM